MAEQTFEYNGKTLSLSEIQAKMEELKNLQKLQKEAKKAGLITKAVSTPKEKSAEVVLLAGNFAPVITANAEVIQKLFEATKTTEKPAGNIGINIATGDDCAYDIQILSKAARKAQVEEMKSKKAKEAEAKKAAEAEKATEEKAATEVTPGTVSEQ